MTLGAAAALVKAKEAGRFGALLLVLCPGERRPMLEVCRWDSLPPPTSAGPMGDVVVPVAVQAGGGLAGYPPFHPEVPLRE
jgi:hypothetical protein